MKVGFIGTGNMANAIVNGIVKNGFISGEDVLLYDRQLDKSNELASQVNGKSIDDMQRLVDLSEIIVLAVKPNIIETLIESIKGSLIGGKHLLVSIAGGITTNKIEKYVGKSDVPIVRVMPNVNAMIGCGAAAVTGNESASKEQVAYVVSMFNAIGKAWEVPEKDFSAYTAMAGSSPAYAYLFIDSIARAGVKHGLTKQDALEYAAQSVLGSAKMILESDENPWTLIDRVCSPGGTTIEGLYALEEGAFIATVGKGIDAVIEKDKKMDEL